MGRKNPEFDQRLRAIADRLAVAKLTPQKPTKKQPNRVSSDDMQDGIRELMNASRKKSRKA